MRALKKKKLSWAPKAPPPCLWLYLSYLINHKTNLAILRRSPKYSSSFNLTVCMLKEAVNRAENKQPVRKRPYKTNSNYSEENGF